MKKQELVKFDIKGIPKEWKESIMKVYMSYPKECMPQGICDMAYIINVISHQLGLSDGKGNYKQFIIKN